MVDNFTHAKPKPQSKKSPKGKHLNSTAQVFLCKTNGSWGEHMAFSNWLNAGVAAGVIEGFTSKDGYPKADGRVERTYHIDIVPAKSYDTAAEQSHKDKSGDLYVFQSVEDFEVHKVGISIHVPVRVKQVSRHFQEEFKRIHSVHCDNAKQRETWVHDELRKMGAVDLGNEKFRLKEKHLAFLYSLENE